MICVYVACVSVILLCCFLLITSPFLRIRFYKYVFFTWFFIVRYLIGGIHYYDSSGAQDHVYSQRSISGLVNY